MPLGGHRKEFMHKEHNKTGSSGDKWIGSAIKNKGALHKELGVPADKKIPAKKLEKATHSKNTTLKRRAILAETLKSFKNKK
jgi:hypothetical protein